MNESVLKGKTFLFITGSSGRITLMSKIARELQRRFEVTSYFLSFSTKTENLFAAEGINNDKVIHLLPGKMIAKPDFKFLHSREKKYDFNLFDLWELFASRLPKRRKIKSRDILRKMEFYIRELENVVKKINPDYVFITGISVFQGVLAQKIFSSNKIPTLDLTDSRIPGRFTFATTLDARWPLLVKRYENIKKNGLSIGAKKDAQEFINKFRLNPTKPDNSAKIQESIRARLKRYYSYKNVLFYRREIPDLRPYLWYPIKDKIMLFTSHFEKPVAGEKYVLFPLQIQPEASTSIWGKWYCNQLALVENIAKSVPCGYKVYVKEHVKNYSTRPLGFNKEIKKYRNVRLISPFANNIKLIKNSALVITITGTAGWEAILHQKPVLTFGDVFYNVFDEVSQIRNFYHLPHMIRQRINMTTDLTKTLKFVNAIQQATFEGIGTIPGDCQNRSLKDSNIQKLVNGIETFADEIQS